MRFHVIGCGSIGRRHIQNLLTLGVPASDITVEDKSHEAVLAVADIGVSSGPRGRADATLICTPAQEHAGLVRECIALGLPFFVEKPATTRVASLSDEEWSTTVPHLVGCNMLFRPEIEKLFANVEAATWVDGRERMTVSFWCDSDMSKWPGKYTAPPVFEFCHEIDIALRLDPKGFFVVSYHRSDGLVAIKMKGMSRQIDAHVHVGWLNGLPYARGARLSTPSSESGWSWSKVPENVNQMYLDEMWHFMSVARRAEQSRNTLAMARRVVEICEEASR